MGLRILYVGLLAVMGAMVPALAHHSFTAEFDIDRRVEVEGVVTRLDWMNPHAWLYMDVVGEDGEIQHWSFELGAPTSMIRMGWHRTDLKEGDRVTVEGAAARYQEFAGSARTITFPDGHAVFGGRVPAAGQP